MKFIILYEVCNFILILFITERLLSLMCDILNCCWFQLYVCITDRLPYSIRILLESAIRNCDNFQVTKEDVEKIIDWENTSTKQVEIPFKPARVLLQVNSQLLKFRYSEIFLLFKCIMLSSFENFFYLLRILLECQLLLIWPACETLWISLAVIQTKSILWYSSFLCMHTFMFFMNEFVDDSDQRVQFFSDLLL